MQKTLMALSSIPKPIIKADNRLNGYISNFTHNQKIQNKSNLCVYFKVTSFLKSKNLVFTFDLKRELDSSSFSALATKLFHIAGPRIQNLLLCGLVLDLL